MAAEGCCQLLVVGAGDVHAVEDSRLDGVAVGVEGPKTCPFLQSNGQLFWREAAASKLDFLVESISASEPDAVFDFFGHSMLKIITVLSLTCF